MSWGHSLKMACFGGSYDFAKYVLMRQSKENKQSWTKAKNFDVCLCVF